ncbi:MAG: mrcA [Acidimicrobiales bacterium]|nr:mrcA [Acidimicrobiales bacterium]
MVAIVSVLAGALALITPQASRLVSAHRSDHERISLTPLAERSLIFDRNSSLLATLNSDQNRVQVPLAKVPVTVTGSILAAEDNDFYKHKGVNLRSVVRAVDANLNSGGISQGGSTITQQVVKNSLTGNKQDFSRKAREALLALELEKQMSKQQILERYVNSVYFGHGAYGVQAASELYFNKDVSSVNWAEGALLAALIRSPNSYDPFRNPKLAKTRRDIVFERLVKTKRLSRDQVTWFKTVPLPTVANVPRPPNDYFVEEVKQQLLDDPRFGLGLTPAARNRAVFEGGLRVFTTFDPIAQLKALQARNETVPGGKGDGTFDVIDPVTGQPALDPNGKPTFGTQAIASIEPGTGAVRIMVGGPGFEKYKYNLTTGRGRQPGSSMKTFVLTALFENGFVPNDTVNGGSCAFTQGRGAPIYAPGTGSGGVATITSQTQRSSNCAFVRLGQVVGLERVVDVAKRMGITTPLDANHISLPLGTSEVRPLDMAAAYSVLANDGVRNEPYFVERIEDRKGKVIYQHRGNPQQVLDPQTARLVTQVLVANVNGGTGKNARLGWGQVAAGKTGTTNNSSNVWFVGYTPQLATAIWMGVTSGNVDLARAGLGGATGGRYPATTWGDLYQKLYDGTPLVPFVDPGPTRPGQSVGIVPNEIGGRSNSLPRRAPNPFQGGGGGGNGGGGGGGGGGGAGVTPSPTVPPTFVPPPPTPVPTTVPAPPTSGP